MDVNFTASYVDTTAGLTRAGGTGGSGGQVTIDGGATGQLFSSGRFEAAGTTGGQIDLFGKSIFLIGATVDASAAVRSGGRIRVGGDYQGCNLAVPNALTVDVSSTTVLHADGVGGGGRVIVWSETSTEFAGGISARAGGFIEVSSHGQLTYRGQADAGKAGTLLLDPKDLVIASAPMGIFPHFNLVDPDPDDPDWGVLTVLDNGNLVAGGSDGSGNGIVGLFNGQTGALISALIQANSAVALTNGNFVATGKNGSATWGSGTIGVSGMVSVANSLIEGGSQYTPISVTPLTNGNFVVHGINWNGSEGAVTWCSGLAPTTGTVSAANSLVGTNTSDNVGGNGDQGGVTALSNGNYVVDSPYWNNSEGAVTWGNGMTGISGVISAANSLIDEDVFGGSTADDIVAVTPLTNGNYVVSSTQWNAAAGAVTWANGMTGVDGIVSAANSLVGNSQDVVGEGGVTALTNGNYVVVSQSWNDGQGAITWANGTTGITGAVSAANSLVGNSVAPDPADALGYGGVIPLTNGNYVVDSPFWNNYEGAVTWCDGTTETIGALSLANSIVGSMPEGEFNFGDQVGGGMGGSLTGGGVTALANGNYVVFSPYWHGSPDSSATGIGAATWGNGATGTAEIVSAANSLVGSSTSDFVGLRGVTALANGNYVVDSPFWNDATGALTWGNGMSGISGVISATNSLIGSTAGDELGYSDQAGAVTPLPNGNYVVLSSAPSLGGAATWENGSTGSIGTLSSVNSLIGVGANSGSVSVSVSVFPNSNYVVVVSGIDVSSVTWLNGTTGTTLDGQHTLDAQNTVYSLGGLDVVLPIQSGSAFVTNESQYPNPNVVSVDFTDPTLLTYPFGQNQTIILTPDFLTGTLDAGTNLVLQASDDITVISPIQETPTGSSGSLTLQAGNQLLLQAGIDMAGAYLNLSGTLAISIQGTTPGDGVTAGSYTQVNVTGSVNLNGALLDVSHIATTTPGTSFTIVQTTAGVTGQFSGLSEGAPMLAQDGTPFTISYQGNGGKNVVLTQSGVATQPGQLGFSAASYSATEGGANAIITVTRTNGSSGSVTVAYATGGGAAVAGRDYTSTSGTLTFADGVTSQSFTVPILNNGQTGGSETVDLTLSNPTDGATLADNFSAILTLQNTSGSSLVSQFHFSVAHAHVSRTAGLAALTVVRTGGVSSTETVQYATSDGTARAGTDYAAASGTLSFGPDVTAQTISLPILNDGQNNGDESLTLTLSNPTGGATLDSPITLTLTINDPFPQEPMPSNLPSVAGIFTHSSEAFSLFVAGAYGLYLKRLPDAEGLAYWIDQLQNQGVTDEKLETDFLSSGEYIASHGGTGNAWVIGMYQDLLGRNPDPAGLAYWTNVLSTGGSAYSVAYGFAASAEREGQRIAGDYEIYLGRQLDAAGQAYWVNQFLNGARNEDVVAGFLGSAEYYQNPDKGQSNRTAWIDSVFQDVLQRDPSAADLAFWLTQLA